MSRSRNKNVWHRHKSLSVKNIHVRYDRPISLGSNAKVEFFFKKVKLSDQGQRVKIVVSNRNVLSQRIHIRNTNALCILFQRL